MYDTAIAITEETADSKVPTVCGFKVLVAIPTVAEKTDGGVYRPDQMRSREETASIVGRVIDLGPDAYKDEKRFSKPYCEVGDWVIFRSYSGTRFRIGGQEFRLINDDTVEAVVVDPSHYERV